MGSFIAIIFFFILFIAAITSSISMLEVIVAYVSEELGLSRKGAIALSVSVILVLGSLCSLSQGVLSDITLFGNNIFDCFDKFSANILLPLGGLFAVIFVGWRMKKADVTDEITSAGIYKYPSFMQNFIYFSIKYLAPLVVAVIMLQGLL